MSKAMKKPADVENCMRVEVFEPLVEEFFKKSYPKDPLQACIRESATKEDEDSEVAEHALYLDTFPLANFRKRWHFEELGEGKPRLPPSIEKPPVLELKQLPSNLRNPQVDSSMPRASRKQKGKGVPASGSSNGVRHSNYRELSESTGNLSFDSDDGDDDEGGVIGNGEEHHQIPVAPPISEYNIIIDALPSGTINDLNEIVKRMVTAGFGKECSHMYSSCRREFLEESMSRLRLQKLSIDEVHKMPWQEVEEQIERWVKAANLALRILFPSERRLCDHVFFGLSSAADLSFMEVCHGSSIQLLNFADAISIGSRSPERLFKVLDVFETLRDLMPEFELVFSDQYCLILRNEAMTIWKRLGEAIRGIFMELENLIRQDPAKAAVPGGGLHPITSYVMNYLRAACRSRQTLEQIFERDSSSSLSFQMSWIMELLQSNLDVKSKIYRDPALCSIFMMNNGRYIVQKVNDSELDLLLGDDWIRKHNAKIRQYHSNYQKSSWNKILGILKLENSSSSAPNAAEAARSMKEKLKLFNLSFDEICKTQFPWSVFDEQFREELKTSVTKILLPAYGNFIGKLQNIPEMEKHPDRLIKYRVEDIEARINELFQGNGSPAGCGRK
ncbi:hypothetical protein EZV62_003659 [Acer yangbiense]|uniref:Exocyst subunit Exo70 family protein n=1 Tax=Acer yangbiense TaxID=1000413 RepID=A0A5C7IIA9_9ROSI|nr:hypothetical protein EZV62_003659 [Acer yangbiense]